MHCSENAENGSHPYLDQHGYSNARLYGESRTAHGFVNWPLEFRALRR